MVKRSDKKRSSRAPRTKVSTIKPARKAEALSKAASLALTDSVQIACGRHQLEQSVQRELLSHPKLSFESLVVHRTPTGVCLEGVLEADEESPDVCRLARAVAGVDHVINHLTVKRHNIALKG